MLRPSDGAALGTFLDSIIETLDRNEGPLLGFALARFVGLLKGNSALGCF